MFALLGAAAAVVFPFGGPAGGQTAIPIATGTAQGQLTTGHVGFDGTNYLVGIQGDAADRRSVGAQLVAPSGALVGPLISTGRTGGAPGVGFDGTNYVLVWSDDATIPPNQIYGQLISPPGDLVGVPFPIGPASGGHEITGGAFDGTNYLILWRCSTPEICTGIYGQLVTPSGTLVGPVVTISETARKDARVAFDGSNYLVVWHGVGPAIDTVFARFVSPAGTLAGSAFIINASPAPSDFPPAIAFDGTNYLVLWNDEVGGAGTHEWDIFGQLVAPSGALVGGVIPITSAPGAQRLPFAAFDGATYLVTWTDFSNDSDDDFACDPGEGTCADVYGQYLSPSGTAVGSAFAIAAHPDNQMFSQVTFAGGKYVVVWNSGATLDPGGDLIGRDVLGAFLAPGLACVGDCGGDGEVTVDELLTMVNIALGEAGVSVCVAGDANHDGEVTIDEILTAVNHALTSCGG